uniref:Uncharacterized protein n=2 Tax=Salix viminalis TaxID=40686 RepID=A0A6N2MZS9_SALVM
MVGKINPKQKFLSDHPTIWVSNCKAFEHRRLDQGRGDYITKMATLADSFLADLDELSDNDADIVEEDDVEAGNMEEDVDGDLADIEALNFDDLDTVSKLQKTQRYNDIMEWKMHLRRAQVSKIMEWYWKMILNIS